MSATAAAAARNAIRVRASLSQRHSLRAEAVLVLSLYGLYELVRGFAGGDTTANRHALRLVALERSLHLFLEADVQRAAHSIPGVISLLGFAYLTLHLSVTAGVLLWLHRRRPDVFPFVRTTLLLASGLALIGFLVYPTAPPRLAGIGIADTVSNGHVDLNHGLISSLYNPDAAVPSMHVGYALIVAASLFFHGRRRLVRALAALYPPFVLLVVVATGNHFFFDAASGALVAVARCGGGRLPDTTRSPDRNHRTANSTGSTTHGAPAARDRPDSSGRANTWFRRSRLIHPTERKRKGAHMASDNPRRSVLLIGKSQLVLDGALAGLRDLGYTAEATNGFADITARFDAREIDVVVFGGQVPPDLRAELREEISAINPRVIFVQGLAGIPGLIINQVQGAFARDHQELVRAPTFAPDDRSIGLTLPGQAEVKVTIWWQTSFVPPDPKSDSLLLLNDRLAAGDHAVTVPDLVPPKAAFATVQVDAAIYVFSIATEQ